MRSRRNSQRKTPDAILVRLRCPLFGALADDMLSVGGWEGIIIPVDLEFAGYGIYVALGYLLAAKFHLAVMKFEQRPMPVVDLRMMCRM